MGKLVSVLKGEIHSPPPIWLMRQAGRYLDEYRSVRAQAGGFLDLCRNPDLATEVTLQPIRRFGFDAAILFSDILVIPDALGQSIWFAEGEGPRLTPIRQISDLPPFDRDDFLHRLRSPFETLKRLRQVLPVETDLIGFCGAPWTVASYMIAGRGTPDLMPIREFAAERPDDLQAIIDRLVDASILYLKAQIDAGADVLQIFESWAQVLVDGDFDRWSLDPISRIVDALQDHDPSIPVIVFPRKAGEGYRKVAGLSGVSGISIDPDIDLNWVAKHIQPLCAVQGNLDPIHLVEGPASIDSSLKRMFEHLSSGPWIANLGHGILPKTPIKHVQHFIDRVREYRN